jgi:hypothetical protein
MFNKKSNIILITIGEHLIGAIVILIIISWGISLFSPDFSEELRNSHTNSIFEFIQLSEENFNDKDCFYMFNLYAVASTIKSRNSNDAFDYGFKISKVGITEISFIKNTKEIKKLKKFNEPITLNIDDTSSIILLKDLKIDYGDEKKEFLFKPKKHTYEISYDDGYSLFGNENSKIIGNKKPFLIYNPKTNKLLLSNSEHSNYIASQKLCTRESYIYEINNKILKETPIEKLKKIITNKDSSKEEIEESKNKILDYGLIIFKRVLKDKSENTNEEDKEIIKLNKKIQIRAHLEDNFFIENGKIRGEDCGSAYFSCELNYRENLLLLKALKKEGLTK